MKHGILMECNRYLESWTIYLCTKIKKDTNFVECVCQLYISRHLYRRELSRKRENCFENNIPCILLAFLVLTFSKELLVTLLSV
jgi:hypothetical protein